MLRVRRGKTALLAAAIGATLPATFSMAQQASWTYQGTAFPWTGTWNVATNWSPNSAFPNSATAVANFGPLQVAGATGTVVINNAPITLNKLNFTLSGTNAFSYLITGNGTLASLNVADKGIIEIGGIGTDTIASATLNTAVLTPAGSTIVKQGAGNLVLTGTNNFGGGYSSLSVAGLAINGGTVTAVGLNALRGLGVISTANTGVLELQGVTLGSAGTTGFKVIGGIGSTGSFAGGMVHAVGNNTWYGPWFSLGGSAGVDAGGTLTVDGDLVDGEAPAQNGFSKVGGDGLMQVNTAILNGPLTITGGTLRLKAGATPNLTSNRSSANALAISGTGKLDITNNTFIVDYTGSSSPASTIKSYLESGYNFGTWDGPGIVSANAAADASVTGLTTIGYADNADLANGNIPAESVVLKYTYLGDADLTGQVDLDDFNLFLYGFDANNAAPKTWVFGNFDYNNTIDLDDFNLFLYGYQSQGGSLGALSTAILGTPLSFSDQSAMLAMVAAVPEPMSVGLLSVAAGALALRRRRKGVAK